MTHSQVGDGGPSFVASLFELLGIHRNVARGPKEQKESKVKTAAAQTLKEQSKTPDAQSWIDSTGAALARDQLMNNYGALTPIELPPSSARKGILRSEEHTSELQSLMRISYAVFCLQQKNYHTLATISYLNTN